MKNTLFSLLALMTWIANGDSLYGQVSAAADAEWNAYGHDGGGSRYSALQQVNDKNVTQLKPAWEFHTGELKTYDGTEALSKAVLKLPP